MASRAVADYQWQGAAMLRATTNPGPADVPRTLNLDDEAVTRGWLNRIWPREDVRGALLLATPVLSDAIEAVVRDRQTDPRNVRRTALSTVSYLLRWQHRPTPHGLFDGTDFHRESGDDVIARACGERARTPVYESLDVRSSTWVSLASLGLAQLTRRRVICTAYESRAGDSNLGAHHDQWLGVIVQIRGAKRWLIWPDDDSGPRRPSPTSGTCSSCRSA